MELYKKQILVLSIEKDQGGAKKLTEAVKGKLNQRKEV